MEQTKEKKWAQSPRKELVENVYKFKKGSVLDLGGSDGVNGIYLAQQGFEVTNIDKDAEGIATFTAQAADSNLNVTGLVKNIGEYLVDSEYDNIISFFTLHFLDFKHVESLLASIMENTSSGGINMLMGFTDVGEFNVDTSTNTKFYPHENYLADLYKNNGFEILVYEKSLGQTKSGKDQEKYILLARKN